MVTTISGSLQVVDTRGEHPSIRLATDEERLKQKKGVFLLSESGLDQLGHFFKNYASSDSANPHVREGSELKLAQLKLCIIEISKGRWSGVTQETMDKARAIAFNVFSKVKISNFRPACFEASHDFEYITVLFTEMDQILAEKDAKSLFHCLLHLIHSSQKPALYQKIMSELALLKNRVGDQDLSYFVEWFLDHLSTAFPNYSIDEVDPWHDISSDWFDFGMRNIVGIMFSFLERISPEAAKKFPQLFGQKLESIIQGCEKCPDLDQVLIEENKGEKKTLAQPCKKKQKISVPPTESALAETESKRVRRIGVNKISALRDIKRYFEQDSFYKDMFQRKEIQQVVNGFVRQERRKACMPLGKLPKEDRIEIYKYLEDCEIHETLQELADDLQESGICKKCQVDSWPIVGLKNWTGYLVNLC